jgi:hypothetical protein
MAQEWVSVLGELASGGMVVVDRFEDDQPDDHSGEEQIAFRTLVQLDGDMCLSIHAEALARPDFGEALARHTEHVRAVLGDELDRLRSFAATAIWRGRVLGIVVGAGSGNWLGKLEVLLLDVSVAVVMTATAVVGAVLFGAIGRAGVRMLLRRRGLDRYDLHDRDL